MPLLLTTHTPQHTHTYTHTHIYTHTCTITHTLTHIHTHTHTHARSHSHAYTYTHKYMHTHKHLRIHTRPRKRTRARTHTPTHTHAPTRTHTYTRAWECHMGWGGYRIKIHKSSGLQKSPIWRALVSPIFEWLFPWGSCTLPLCLKDSFRKGSVRVSFVMVFLFFGWDSLTKRSGAVLTQHAVSLLQ